MIGAGIVTCNRESFFINCMKSLPRIDFLVVINDGKPYQKDSYTSKPDIIIEHKQNKGIAKSKNEVIRILLEKSCEHIFLLEDDISIKKDDVFEHYVNTAKKTGIYHLNFAFHGNGNRNKNGNPVSRKIIYEDEVEILSLNKNLLGAFTYYHKSLIERFDLIDESYKNGLEHVDHTYQIIKGGYHPPFWWFADAPESYEYIFDQDDDHSKSIIRKNKILWKIRMLNNIRYFKKKNGFAPNEIHDSSEEYVLSELNKIQNRDWGIINKKIHDNF